MSTPLASRYLIRRKLGEGGMAEVLEAIAQGDSGFTRRVAIKRLREGHHDDPSFSRMFLDEARIASRLHHGSIVGVLDYGVVDDRPFQILEFVDGDSARTLAARGKQAGKPMPLDVALYIATEMARALHYAHTSRDEDGASRGVVHRDVKPANILLSHAGDVKLADFGIAFATERMEKTQTGVAKGTPGFMAPEQIAGGAVDARTDIFALGCTLHALAFGSSPLAIEGNLERLVSGKPFELDASAPEDVAAILRRATDPLPSRRYENAAELAEAIGAALASRLRGDPKGALIKWLESLAETPRPAAALDALMMPEALLEVEDGSWRLQTTRASTPPAPTPEPPPPPVRSSRRPWVIGAAVVVALAAVGALGVHLGRAHGGVAAAPSAPASTPPETTVAPPASTAPPAESVAAAPPTVVATHASHHRVHAVAPAPTSAAPPPRVLGTLAVRGGAYRGATVGIDGRVEPFGAPHYFDLPIGKHALELRVDGGVVARGAAEVLAEHTPTHPLYWP
jgi:serine/threonine protein kinase